MLIKHSFIAILEELSNERANVIVTVVNKKMQAVGKVILFPFQVLLAKANVLIVFTRFPILCSIQQIYWFQLKFQFSLGFLLAS